MKSSLEKPIILPDWKVRALPHATQVRAVMKPQPPDADAFIMKCPYPVGQRLWVREAWKLTDVELFDGIGSAAVEFKDGTRSFERLREKQAEMLAEHLKWRMASALPREFSRYTLEVTGVKAERLQEISEEDAKAEGMRPLPLQIDEPGAWWTGDIETGSALHAQSPVSAFVRIWDSTAKLGEKWADSPWTWVLTVKTLEASNV